VAIGVMRRGPEEFGVGPDGDSRRPTRAEASRSGGDRWRSDSVRTWRFWSVSAPFALGLAAQVGVLTHLVALVTPMLGTGGAAREVQHARQPGSGNQSVHVRLRTVTRRRDP